MDNIYLHLFVGAVILLAFFFAFKIVEGTWAPPALLFVAGFTSSSYLYAYIILGLPISPPNFAYENFDEALWLTSGCFVAMLAGYILYGALNSRRQASLDTSLNEFMGPHTARVFSGVALASCASLVIYNLISGSFSGIRGEGAYLSDSDVNVLDRAGFIVSHLIAPINVALFLGAKTLRNQLLAAKMLRYAWFSIAIMTAVTLLSFNRQLIVYTFLCLTLIFHYRIRRIGVREIAIGLPLLIVVQIMRDMRTLDSTLTELRSGQVADYLVEQIGFENLFGVLGSILTGIAGWDVFSNVLNIVPFMDNYFYGSSYLNSIVGLFKPRVLGLSSYDEVTLSVWYMQMYAPGTINHGYDFSMLAEAYINFGYFMPIWFFFIGVFLYFLSSSIRLTQSPFLLFFSVITLVVLTFGLRSDSNVVLKAVFFQTVTIIFMIKLMDSLSGSGARMPAKYGKS
jgi:hypothetical protein